MKFETIKTKAKPNHDEKERKLSNNNDLDDQILDAIRAGATTREKLMAITNIRHRTWAVIGQRLTILVKRGVLIASKTAWRIA